MPSYRPICDIWILGRPKVGYYGAYPNGFPERARALLGVTSYDAVLHVCGGKARDYPQKPRGYGPRDMTLDLDPDLRPDFVQAATDPLPKCPHVGGGSWAAVIADPPYTADDADHYTPGRAAFPSANRILRNMLDAVRPGGRVGMLHYVVPSPPSHEAKRNPVPYRVRFVACVGVFVGYNNRMRAFSVFEREAL